MPHQTNHKGSIHVHFTMYVCITQTHKGEHHINKIKIFNIMIQNKLQGAKAQKQGKQETPHRTPLVAHILDRPIRSRAEAPASNTSQHAQRMYVVCSSMYVCITPTHKGEHGIMGIQTIIMRNRTHSMQATSNLLQGPHRPITTPPQWDEQLPHGTHGQTPRQASPTMPYTSGSCPGTTLH
jgi:hypothetical protein